MFTHFPGLIVALTVTSGGKVLTGIVNNSTNFNKTNDHLLSEIIELEKDHDI